MVPQTRVRKKANDSKVNLTISVVVHAVLVIALFYFAARQGWLGKQAQKIAVTMVRDKPEKPKEQEKPKEAPPKIQQAKIPPPTVAAETKPEVATAPPTVVPQASEAPAFNFDDGAKDVIRESDPVQLYKGRMEYELRNQWNKPDNMADDNYVADVQVSVDKYGHIDNAVLQKSSGNDRWDQSVKDVFQTVKAISIKPPTNFPSRVTIRFDVELENEPISLQ